MNGTAASALEERPEMNVAAVLEKSALIGFERVDELEHLVLVAVAMLDHLLGPLLVTQRAAMKAENRERCGFKFVVVVHRRPRYRSRGPRLLSFTTDERTSGSPFCRILDA